MGFNPGARIDSYRMEVDGNNLTNLILTNGSIKTRGFVPSRNVHMVDFAADCAGSSQTGRGMVREDYTVRTITVHLDNP